jgi:hypothetical protein
MRLLGRVDNSGSPTLIEICGNLASALILILVPSVYFFSKSVLEATAELFPLLQAPVTMERGTLIQMLSSSVLSVFLVKYLLQYRYRSDKIFGLDFRWYYLTPFGHICCLRASCPACRKEAPEPCWALLTDNYLCDNCHHNTENHRADRMEYPWKSAVQKRVYAKLLPTAVRHSLFGKDSR